jgi:hypothetical protein
MSLSTNTTYRVFVEKLGGTDPANFVGDAGEVFLDPSVPELKLSDGTTAGGVAIGGGGGASYWVSTAAGIHTLSNVGVGTTNPTTKLQIDGVLGFGTFIAFGQTRTNIRIGDNTTGANLTTGYDNIFMGVGAGNSTTTNGRYNNFFGRNAGYYNTSGRYNNFFGRNAGYYNTIGNDNNFMGREVGRNNTIGSDNNFLGYRAGYYNTNGDYNNFLGRDAGYYNTTGSHNNYFGYQAGNYNTTGSYNNFLGNQAGYYHTTGSTNNFIGHYAGYYHTTGSYNNYFGYQAGNYNTTGNNNNFFGRYTGIHPSTSYRIVIGQGESAGIAFDVPKNADKQFAVGINSTGTAEYWLVGDENFNIGINSTAPTAKLDVIGDVRIGIDTSQGVILTDANGVAWRLVVNTDGTLTTASV